MTAAIPHRRPHRFVALGDSLTEGLCDTSRRAAGEYRGWADRLAEMLAAGSRRPVLYANLAVRSRRMADLVEDQVPRALALRPDLVSVFMGSNDLVRRSVDPARLAADLEGCVVELRRAGSDVLLVTPFLPARLGATPFVRRFAVFDGLVRDIAARTGAILVDVADDPVLRDRRMWAADRVHLGSAGHRLLAYRAAAALGVPDAKELGALDAALHDAPETVSGSWLVRDAAPWVWRRLRGRTAGDGRVAKHDGYVRLAGGARRVDSARG